MAISQNDPWVLQLVYRICWLAARCTCIAKLGYIIREWVIYLPRTVKHLSIREGGVGGGKGNFRNSRKSVSWLVHWCFDPCQPQRVTSGLETNVNPSPTYNAHESRETAKFFKSHKTSLHTHTHTHTHTHARARASSTKLRRNGRSHITRGKDLVSLRSILNGCNDVINIANGLGDRSDYSVDSLPTNKTVCARTHTKTHTHTHTHTQTRS